MTSRKYSSTKKKYSSRSPQKKNNFPEISMPGEIPEIFLGQSSISEQLKEHGIYYITGEIESGSLLEIQQDVLLKHMDPNWKDDIQLIVNSIGGETAEGWALIDLLNFVKMDVRTTGLGCCMSLGAMLLACGTQGKRAISPNTSIMVHGASLDLAGGNLQQLTSITESMRQEYDNMLRFWTRHSKYSNDKDVKVLFLDGVDHYFTADQALECGIADYIIAPPAPRVKPKK